MNTFDLFSLKGKTALITGGRAMYGKGATLALADAGADIYLASHSIESAQEFVEELKREKGVKVEAIPFEQGDIDSIRNLVDTVIQKAGRIDVFINCSRILPQGDGGVGWFQDEKQMDEGVRVNTAASLYMTTLVGDQMIRQHSGSIVTFGSMMGLIGVEEHNYDGNPGMAAFMPWTNQVFPPGYAMPPVITASTASALMRYVPAAFSQTAPIPSLQRSTVSTLSWDGWPTETTSKVPSHFWPLTHLLI